MRSFRLSLQSVENSPLFDLPNCARSKVESERRVGVLEQQISRSLCVHPRSVLPPSRHLQGISRGPDLSKAPEQASCLPVEDESTDCSPPPRVFDGGAFLKTDGDLTGPRLRPTFLTSSQLLGTSCRVEIVCPRRSGLLQEICSIWCSPHTRYLSRSLSKWPRNNRPPSECPSRYASFLCLFDVQGMNELQMLPRLPVDRCPGVRSTWQHQPPVGSSSVARHWAFRHQMRQRERRHLSPHSHRLFSVRQTERRRDSPRQSIAHAFTSAGRTGRIATQRLRLLVAGSVRLDCRSARRFSQNRYRLYSCNAVHASECHLKLSLPRYVYLRGSETSVRYWNKAFGKANCSPCRVSSSKKKRTDVSDAALCVFLFEAPPRERLPCLVAVDHSRSQQSWQFQGRLPIESVHGDVRPVPILCIQPHGGGIPPKRGMSTAHTQSTEFMADL